MLHREDYQTAYAGFAWPDPAIYNFATDWFDGLAEERGDQIALWVIDPPSDRSDPDVEPGASGRELKLTFAELRDRSIAVGRWFSDHGLRRGDRLLVVLGNCVALWEVMLAAIRIGAVIIPATPQLSPDDLADRVDRGHAKLLVADLADADKFARLELELGRVGVNAAGADLAVPAGWLDYAEISVADGLDSSFPGCSKAADPLLLYFTSGTTAQPKLVQHSQTSYPIGHLATMYWMGLRPGDVHCNISSPGWAKHAWSNFFTPWLAGATVLVYNYARFDPTALLAVLARTQTTTFCAPPTVWRMLVQSDLAAVTTSIRECLSAGEPLNPEVIEQVRASWDITIRDGYGQTETSAQVGNPPGSVLKLGSMGRPLPGFSPILIDPATGAEDELEGELCLGLNPRPLPLMAGYKADSDTFDPDRNAEAFAGEVYHTGDVVKRDNDGYLTYVGRADDVFKASDYRISPFELESVLIEHPAVAEAAIVPSPDSLRLAVPKAYVVLAAGHRADADTARSILSFAREKLAPYQRIRRLEFADLPKTISGKIRRVELREAEQQHTERPAAEFRDSDFEL